MIQQHTYCRLKLLTSNVGCEQGQVIFIWRCRWSFVRFTKYPKFVSSVFPEIRNRVSGERGWELCQPFPARRWCIKPFNDVALHSVFWLHYDRLPLQCDLVTLEVNVPHISNRWQKRLASSGW